MTVKQEINIMLDSMPETKIIQIYDFVRFILNDNKLNLNEVNVTNLSERALDEWNTKEEDEFWKNL